MRRSTQRAPERRLDRDCTEVSARAGPREEDGAKGEVLFALEEIPHDRGAGEDRLAQRLAVRAVQSQPERCRQRHQNGGEDDRQVGPAGGTTKDHGRVDERDCGQPARVPVDVLHKAQPIDCEHAERVASVVGTVPEWRLSDWPAGALLWDRMVRLFTESRGDRGGSPR